MKKWLRRPIASGPALGAYVFTTVVMTKLGIGGWHAFEFGKAALKKLGMCRLGFDLIRREK